MKHFILYRVNNHDTGTGYLAFSNKALSTAGLESPHTTAEAGNVIAAEHTTLSAILNVHRIGYPLPKEHAFGRQTSQRRARVWCVLQFRRLFRLFLGLRRPSLAIVNGAPSLHAGVTAIDRQLHARHIARGRRCQEDSSRVQLALVAVTLLWDHRLGVGLEEVGVECLLREWGVEVARTDGVDRDAILAPLGGQGAGEVDDATLGGVVRAGAGDLVAHQTVHGGDVDGAAVLGGNHGLLGHGTRDTERTEQIDVDLVAKDTLT